MYGAFIGDIVGSKYEFDNIKTKNFPLFSEDCDYTDDTVMTAAVAKAILLSSQEQNGQKGKGFQAFLTETMQDFGRRYPDPKGAYGGSFVQWLWEDSPKPYGSYGNGSAMRVSPCALAAVTLEEALMLARASADVTHNHPEGIKGAEAVAAAIFLAKCGRSKAEIRQYISERYYNLDFTLDSIRETYGFDVTCQGSVPQAVAAFLESESFEDAIRNVISIGGDCDTTGAITGSIAWSYYTLQSGRQEGCGLSMQEIKRQAMEYLPEEFIEIAVEFEELCQRRAEAYRRTGGCEPVLTQQETAKLARSMPERGDGRSVRIREMTAADIEAVLPLYLTYYNEQEGGCWTEETAGRRIHQVVAMEDAYGLLLEEDGSAIGFAMGYFKQYDDIAGYTLEEIVIAYAHQNRGLGSLLLRELERRVKEKGAACVELQAVKDEQHERYYGNAGYRDAENFVLKVKWLDGDL